MLWLTKLEGGPKRVNHAAVAVENYIYMFGGYTSDETSTEYKSMDVHVLNTITNRWAVHPVSNLEYKENGVVPYKRYGHSAVAYKNKIYVFGGRFDKNASDEVSCFDLELQKWIKCETYGDQPLGRDGHSAVVYNNLMYIFGGFEDDSEAFAKTVYALNLDSFRWTHIHTLGTPPGVRDFHTACCINSKLYIFGGRGTNTFNGTYNSSLEVCYGDLWCLDLKTNEWREITVDNKPPCRRSHSSFVYKDRMYIFGGYNMTLDQFYDDLYEYDPVKNRWREVCFLGEKPTKRRRHSSVLVDDKIYLFGGASSVVVDENSKENKIIEHGDLHILQMDITLKNLALLAVKKWNLDISQLPDSLRNNYYYITRNNRLSE